MGQGALSPRLALHAGRCPQSLVAHKDLSSAPRLGHCGFISINNGNHIPGPWGCMEWGQSLWGLVLSPKGQDSGWGLWADDTSGEASMVPVLGADMWDRGGRSQLLVWRYPTAGGD